MLREFVRKASRSAPLLVKLYLLCEETDSTKFPIIDKYFASMLRKLQFTFPEGATLISCADQKLLTVQEVMSSFSIKKRHSAKSPTVL